LSKKKRGEQGNDDLEVCVWNMNKELNLLGKKMFFGLKSPNFKITWKCNVIIPKTYTCHSLEASHVKTWSTWSKWQKRRKRERADKRRFNSIFWEFTLGFLIKIILLGIFPTEHPIGAG
jgi:hypothetical protein